MLFRESFITDKGAEILARTAAGNGTIVWTRAATSNANTDSDSVADMNRMTDITKTSADSYTSSGVVTNAIVNDARTSVSIYSELTNEEYDGAARTFGAWAKIDGDENDVLAIVARCGTGVTPTTINPASEGVVKAFVDFTLLISAERVQAVEVSETNYYATTKAMNEAIEERMARVVTTHSAADETVGDAQDVLGHKKIIDGATFGYGENGIYINSGTIAPLNVLTNTRNVTLGNTQHPFNSANIRSVYANEVSASAGVFYGGMTAYGTSTFSSVIVNTRATATLLDVTTVTPHNNNSTVGTEQEYFKAAYINTVYINTGIAIISETSNNGYISIHEDEGDLIVSSDLYTESIHTNGITVSGDVGIGGDLTISGHVLGDLIVNNNISVSEDIRVGGSVRAGAIIVENDLTVEGDAEVSGNVTVSNVTVSGKFNGDLNGRIPFLINNSTTPTTVPVGCIVLLWIKYRTAQTYTLSYGKLVTSDSTDYSIGVSCFDETGLNSSNTPDLASGQSFRTLSGAVFNNSLVSHALAIRVE